MKNKFNTKLFVGVVATYALIGYALFFLIHMLPLPRESLNAIVEGLSRAIGSLHNAARANTDPLPMQLTILYSMLGALIISAWMFFRMVLTKENREDYDHETTISGDSRLKIIGLSMLAMLFLAGSAIYFFANNESPLPRQRAYFHDDIAAVSLLLLMGLFSASLPTVIVLTLYSAFSGKKPLIRSIKRGR